jgi:hypothetical protein
MRLNFTAFYEALLEAKSVSCGDGGGSGVGKAGRKLSFTTRLQFNGNLMVGKAYTAQLGLEPGDEFEIKLGRKQVELIPPAPVSPQRQRGRQIRSWDGCMGRPKGKEPQSCCMPFRCWPPPV